MVQRYELVSTEDVGPLNLLLSQGWTPVRETPVGDGRIMVLLERSGGPLRKEGQLAELPLEVIQRCRLFDGLTADEVASLVDVCEVQSHEAGAVLFKAGDLKPAIYIVLEGSVDVVFPELRGENMAFGGFGPPNFIGESTFFSPAEHNATATCTEATRLLVLHRSTYDELLQEGVEAARKLGVNATGTLARRLQSADAWVWELLNEIDSVHIARSWRRFRDRVLRR